MRIVKFMVFFVLALVIATAWPVDGSTDVKQDMPKEIKNEGKKDTHSPAASWANIKSVKPQQPNITEAYKPLEKAYNEYWKHFMDKDYKKMYSMESSRFRKENPFKEDTYDKFIPRNMKLTAVLALETKELENKQIQIKGKYYYSMGALKSVRFFKDTWVKEDKDWKHVPVENPFVAKK